MKLIFDLPSNQREALMLHAEGYSYGEIAEKLNIAKGTVMSTLCRAREKLTELLINDKDQNND
jgi:RNA polymerase sigma factor (sigma-70 family)